MKAIDRGKFGIAIAEELDKTWNNKSYEIIKKSEVFEGHTILRSVWIYICKITPDNNLTAT